MTVFFVIRLPPPLPLWKFLNRKKSQTWNPWTTLNLDTRALCRQRSESELWVFFSEWVFFDEWNKDFVILCEISMCCLTEWAAVTFLDWLQKKGYTTNRVTEKFFVQGLYFCLDYNICSNRIIIFNKKK